MTEAERLAANSRPTLIDIVDMIARQYQCSLKEASEYLAEAVKGLDVSYSEHTMQWRPIETAPKDRRVMLYRPTHNNAWLLTVSAGQYDDDRYAKKPRPYWGSDVERVWGVLACRDNPPTHWMPLPEPPK